MARTDADDVAVFERIAQLPCWTGAVQITPLHGGMTNRNFRVTDRQGQYAVRLGVDIPEHGVMRFNELAAARAAYQAGISPKLVFACDGVLVSQFIEGHTLSDADARKPETMQRIVSLVRRCHTEVPRYLRGPVLTFWVFQVLRNYAGLLRESDHNPLAGRLEALEQLGVALEAAIGPITLVFGHNDLLPANFIDDGKQLWLIDWDYAGFNSPLFDLANLSSNNGYTQEQDEDLCTRYLGRAPQAQFWRGFVAMKQASLLREVLWAAVSYLRSTIAFDYLGYMNGYLARLDALLASQHSIKALG